jgi:cytochrome c peroxidase
VPAFDPVALNPFAPIPEGVERPAMDDVVKLGQLLYFDQRLSRGQDVSCASCHDFAQAGGDGAAVSIGTKTQKGKRNTPTVINAAGAFAQGWDARATTIEDFVLPHVLDGVVMGMGEEKRVLETLESIPAYAAGFRRAFPDEKPAISADTFGRAIAAYVKKLFARARWDRYLAGDKSAVTGAELAGVAMFVEAGCTSCHQGKYLGATQAQKLGIAKPWPPPAGSDPGRFEHTKQDIDRGMFKVPTLRNVTKTAPYLHDGSVATLEEAIRLMARHQVGRELADPQIKAIEAFLTTLEGAPPKELTGRPRLPPSGPKTPKPD